MQVLHEAWTNFRDSINSEKTLQVYEYCPEQFLLKCDLDLESLLNIEPQQLTTLIIKIDWTNSSPFFLLSFLFGIRYLNPCQDLRLCLQLLLHRL